jgi:hypothetical protein
VISLLIDLGLPGLLCGVIFIVIITRTQWPNLKRRWFDSTLKRFHRVFYASFLAQVVVHVLLAGGATTFVTLFLWALIMECLVYSDETLREKRSARTGLAPAQPATAQRCE